MYYCVNRGPFTRVVCLKWTGDSEVEGIVRLSKGRETTIITVVATAITQGHRVEPWPGTKNGNE